MKTDCWKCKSRMPVVTLLAETVDIEDGEDLDGEVFIISDLESAPDEVIHYIQNRAPTYKLIYSHTAESQYFGNVCPNCGSLYGDFHLHTTPGAPFFPNDIDDAKRLFITEVPLNGPIAVEGSFHLGTGDLILSHAIQIS